MSLPPDLPEPLRAFLVANFPQPAAAARALVAPNPTLDFRSAHDERACWSEGGDAGRRAAFERVLLAEAATLNDLEQPFFDHPATGGRLHSPFPELDDPSWWRFVQLWNGEEGATTWLTKPMPALGGRTSLEFLVHAREPSWSARLLGRLRSGTDPRRTVWDAHMERVAANF